jgi:hypothetical protein
MASYYEWPFDYEREITISVLNEQTAVKRLNQFTRNISGCLHLAFSTARGPDSEMVGHVEHDNVILARARPVIFNASKPIFYGSFITTGNGAMLKGRFSVSCWQKMGVLADYCFCQRDRAVHYCTDSPTRQFTCDQSK